jgi:DNA-binding transcriptional LysR family regulator
MEIRQVRYFVEVAAGGSFNQAAARLHLTQPAVSRQIKALEEELGVVLLARGKRSLTLPQEGARNLGQATPMLLIDEMGIKSSAVSVAHSLDQSSREPQTRSRERWVHAPRPICRSACSRWLEAYCDLLSALGSR